MGEGGVDGGRWCRAVCLLAPPLLSPPPVLSVTRRPPSNLALASQSPSSLRVSWTPPIGHVLHYRLTYALASGSGPEKSVGLLVGPWVLVAVGRTWPTCLLRVPALPWWHTDKMETRCLRKLRQVLGRGGSGDRAPPGHCSRTQQPRDAP